MLDMKFVRQNYDLVCKALENRHTKVEGFETLLQRDDQRRAYIAELEDLRALRNQASANVAKLKKAGADANAIMDEMRQVGERIKDIEGKLEEVETGISDIMYGPRP